MATTRGEDLRDDIGPFPGSLSLVIVRQSGEVTCFARGSMDRSHADMLERRLGELAREPADRVVIDLGGVEYIGAAGITALLMAQAIGLERGRPVEVRNVPAAWAGAVAAAGLTGTLH